MFAIASALAFNYFFTEPYRTFHINSPEDVATVIFLFLVALVTSQLAARMQAEKQAARRSASRNATIAGLARQLLSCTSDDQIATVACRELGGLFECNAVMMTGVFIISSIVLVTMVRRLWAGSADRLDAAVR